MSCRRLSLACLLLFHPGLPWAADADELFFKRVDDVNDGELRFLAQLPDKPVHHHQNRITIDEASLERGWVRLQQCHTHLDPVASSQIVYRQDFVRDLRITHAEGIERAWVEGPSVQLANVGPGARLCIEANTRALSERTGHGYLLRNGPYMRRFLDGYYPMRVSLSVRLDTPRLRFQAIDPAPQTGFRVTASDRQIDIEATFEGQLRIESRFELVQ